MFKKLKNLLYKKELTFEPQPRVRHIFCGIKYSYKIKRRQPKTKWLNSVVEFSKIPLIHRNNFLRFKKMPVFAEDFSLKSYKNNKIPNISVILQGEVIKENDFTLETCKIYKKILNNNEKIILSTWNDEDKDYLKKFEDLGIEIVLSQKPENNGRGNVNYQVVSTFEGCKRAQKMNADYILKTRTDQRFYKKNISQFLLSLLKQFPLTVNCDLKSRIVALSFNTFKYRCYGVSDMFLFGKAEDIIKFWDIPLFDNNSQKTTDELENFKKYCPETCLNATFLKNIGIEPNYTLEQSISIYRDVFCFPDKEQVGLFWGKYTNYDSRWDFYYPNYFEEISFNDWLCLYNNIISVEDIISNEPEKMPII